MTPPSPPAPSASSPPVGVARHGFVGARGTDSVALVDSDERAAELRSSGIDFVVQYLGIVTKTIVERVIKANLAFVVVTFANRFDGSQTVVQVQALGLPPGVTVFLDVENDGHLPAAMLIARINAWASEVKAAGYEPGLYVGAGCPLTSEELYGLEVVRYWKGLSRITDRFGALSEPTCGWCMLQLFPSVEWAGMFVDVDAVQNDYESRTVTWTAAAAE